MNLWKQAVQYISVLYLYFPFLPHSTSIYSRTCFSLLNNNSSYFLLWHLLFDFPCLIMLSNTMNAQLALLWKPHLHFLTWGPCHVICRKAFVTFCLVLFFSLHAVVYYLLSLSLSALNFFFSVSQNVQSFLHLLPFFVSFSHECVSAC